MAQRIARAVLALLCAVAVIYGTAMFPAAFDVELRSEQPAGTSGPTTPDESPGSNPGDTGTATTTDSGTDAPAGATETERSTPPPSSATTSTPTVAHSGSAGDGGGGNDGLFARFAGLLLFAGTGLVLLLSFAFVADNADGPRSWLSAIPLPGFVSSVSTRFPSLHRIPQLTTLMIVSAGGGLARLADDVATIAGAIARSLGAGVGPVAGILGRSLAGLPRATGTLLVTPFRTLGTAATLFGGLGFLRGGLSRPRFGGSETPSTDARSAGRPTPTSDDESEPVASVLEAWEAMTDLVPVRNPETTTAVEYARTAVEAGLPAAPVERLTALFREVRYGGRSDDGERVTAARRALDSLTGGDD